MTMTMVNGKCHVGRRLAVRGSVGGALLGLRTQPLRLAATLLVSVAILALSASRATAQQLCWTVNSDGSIHDTGGGGGAGSAVTCTSLGPWTDLPQGSVVPPDVAYDGGRAAGSGLGTGTTGGREGDAVCTATTLEPARQAVDFGVAQQIHDYPNRCHVESKNLGTTRGKATDLYHGPTGQGPHDLPNDVAGNGQGGVHNPTDNGHDSGRSGLDPVNPANGDLVMYRSDFTLPGKAIDFEFVRSYHSRLDYDGPLGAAWDHSYNQRLVPTGSTSCDGELLYMAGNSRTLLFRKISEDPQVVVYEPETPERLALRGHKAPNVPTTWTMTSPDGRSISFDSRGLLQRIEAANHFGLDFTWEAQDSAAEWRLAKIKDSVGRQIELHYFPTGRLQAVVNTTGPAASALDENEQLGSAYEYTDAGDLDNATDAQGRREFYEYSAPASAGPHDKDYVPEGYVHEACALACQPSATSCHAGGACDDAAFDYTSACQTNAWQCLSSCSVIADSLFGEGGWEEYGPSPEVHDSCMNAPGVGCTDRCQHWCDSDAADELRRSNCTNAWTAKDRGDTDHDGHHETLCDGSNLPSSVPVGCAPTCRDACTYWDPENVLCPAQGPCFHRGCYDSCQNNCTSNCSQGFFEGCVQAMRDDCRATCDGACDRDCRSNGREDWANLCTRGDPDDPSSRGCDLDNNLAFCAAQDFGKICQDGCEQGCVASARGTHGEGPRYGYAADLGHNLERIYNGDHVLYLQNTYGQDLSKPSFDSVITQVMGDRTWSLDYRDLVGEKEGVVSPPTSGPAAQNVENLDNYVSEDVCPSVCVSLPKWTDATDFVPWDSNKLLVVKGLATTGGLPVKLATAALPPTLVRISGARATSTTGSAFITPGMKIIVTAGSSDVTFTASTTEPGVFALTGKSDAIKVLGQYAELTFVTESGSGMMRAYPGEPRALTQLASGTCSTAFRATRDDLGRVAISPATACSSDLLLAPLASSADGDGYLDDYIKNGASAFAQMDLFAPTALAPARYTIELRATAVAGVYDQDVGPHDGAPPTGLAGIALDVAIKSPLFAAPAIGPATKLPIFAFHVPTSIRGTDKTAVLYDSGADFLVTTGTKCDVVLIGPPSVGIGDKGAGPKPVKATGMVDGYGAHWIYYYDEKGQSIRTRNIDTNTDRWTNYNIFGDPSAQLEPGGNRTCLAYDVQGSLAQATRYPVPGASGPSTPIVQRFAYTATVPERLQTIFDPRDPTKVLQSFQWNTLGNLVSSRDALNQETTYAPTAWGTPTQTSGPGVHDTYVPDPDSGLVQQVIQDSGSPTELSSLYDFDAVGRPRLAQDPYGSVSSWDWVGSTLETTGFDSGGRHVGQAFTYTGTGDAQTVDDGETVTTYVYDLFGIASKITTTPKQGLDPPAITCRHNGPFGRLLESIGPEGERTKFIYDGEGRLLQVIAGWWPSTNQPWEAGCVLTTTLGATTPDGPQTVQRFDYDKNGWIIGVTDASGERTAVVNDGFGRPIMVTDPSGKQKRAAYNSLDKPTWIAAYAASSGGQATSIPYRDPSISDAGLMAVTQLTYDDKGRTFTQDRWHFDENQAWVGDGMSHTGFAYNELTREVTITDDANGVTKVQSDGAGRPIKRTLATGDIETFTYGTRNGQPTVTHTWPAPTPSGTRSETTILMPWGAPSSVVSSDSGHEATLMSFDYDPRFRPLTQQTTAGETAVMTYDGFGRSKTVSTSKQAGVSETVTLAYDRSDRVRSRVSAIPGGATATTTYQFDVLGRALRVDRPTGIFEAYSYSHGSPRPYSSTDSRGMFKNYLYEPNGQLQSVTVLASLMEPMATWQQRRFVYDGLDRPTQATDTGDSYSAATDDIVTNFTWDSLGGKRKEWNSLLGSSNGMSATLDGRGLPVTEVIGGRTVTRQFDGLGRLFDLKIDAATPSAAHFTYAGLGAAKERLYGNGVKTTFDYDAFGRQVGQLDSKAGVALARWRWPTPLDGVPRMAAFSRQSGPEVAAVFKTDSGGRITSEDYGIKGAAVGALTMAPDLATGAANQAVTSMVGTGFGTGVGGFGTGPAGSGWRAYQLDARNNWKSRTAGTASQAMPSIVVNAIDAITSVNNTAVQLDGSGNMTDDGADLKLAYNRFGEAKMVYLGVIGVRSYRYDALGRRVSEGDLTTGITTLYGFDGASRTVRKQGTGAVELTIDGGGLDEHLVRLDNTANRYYYHQDRNHSVYLVSDSAGAPAEWYEYTAQGEMTILSPQAQVRAASTIRNRFGYQGQPFDLTTGLVDMRARLYRPSWGRFIMADPIGLLGGANMFAFANGSPLSSWDPFGLDFGSLGCSKGKCHTNHHQEDPFETFDWWMNTTPDGGSRAQAPSPFHVNAFGWHVFNEGFPQVPRETYGDDKVGETLAHTGHIGAAEVYHTQCAAQYCHLVWAAGHVPTDKEFNLGALDENINYYAGFGSGALGLAMTPIDLAGEGLLALGFGSNGEIAGAGFVGEKIPPFNPSNGRLNCLNGVCAFFNSVKEGELVTASEDVAWNGGSIELANNQIEDAVDGIMLGDPQSNTLNTARERQFFIVYPGSSAQFARHVMVGINNGGKLLLYDPQTGARFWDLAAFGRFVSFPVIW
jgi:RHS repeat-associated protein